VTLTESETPSAAGGVVYAGAGSHLPIAVITQALRQCPTRTRSSGKSRSARRTTWPRLTTEFQDLNAIGIRLSAERDTAKLLDLIVAKAREITYADAGSLYLVEPGTPAAGAAVSPIVQNDSIPTPLQGYGSRSAPAAIAATSPSEKTVSPLNLRRPSKRLPPGSPFAPDRTHDRRSGVPDEIDAVVHSRRPRRTRDGVLQLINCKRDRCSTSPARPGSSPGPVPNPPLPLVCPSPPTADDPAPSLSDA